MNKPKRPFPDGLSTEWDFNKRRFKLSYYGFNLNVSAPKDRLELSIGFPFAGVFVKDQDQKRRT